MKLITKRTKLIVMTQEEHEEFMRLMKRAQEGQMVNAAETQLSDGSYLAVSIVEQHEPELYKLNDSGKARRR